MNINLWKEIVSFAELKKYPQLPCPHCFNIKLTLDETSIQKRTISKEILEKNSRKYREQKNVNEQKSKKQIEQLDSADGFWQKLIAYAGSAYIDMIDPLNGKQFLFNSFFTCESCNANVTATGVYLQPLKLSEQSPVKSPMIKVDHFSPTIPIIQISKNVPYKIHTELYGAFKHFHFDPLSAASKLRRAIEQFCVDFELKGKNLHQKICSLKEKYPEEAEYLEALKLIGNEGTHDHGVSEIDLLHAFEIVQFVLEIYDRKARYKETQSNYEQLIGKFDEGKIQLRLPKLAKI